MNSKIAIEKYIQCWNKKNFSILLPLISDECTYTSTWLFPVLNGKNEIFEFLCNCLDNYKKTSPKMTLHYGKTRIFEPDLPCAIINVDENPQKNAVVLFEIDNSLISKISVLYAGFYDPLIVDKF